MLVAVDRGRTASTAPNARWFPCQLLGGTMSLPHEPRRVMDAKLAANIESSSSESPVKTVLQTDDRVLARVTDGIYRQPGSAIRELVSNAYDADAKQVVIRTDRPRFHTLSVEDDGIGMTPATLAHLLHHIGGSAKRSLDGAELGIASTADPARSPSGRRLIGKIGIGLFSVAQLTHRFQIITKTDGDPFRTIASVVLRQYSDEDAPPPDEEGGVRGRTGDDLARAGCRRRLSRYDDHPHKHTAADSRHAPEP